LSLFDTHCHLASDDFDLILEETLKNSAQAGVSHLTLIATELEDGRRAKKIADDYKGPLKLYPTLGLHPHDAKKFDDLFAKSLKEEIKDYVAVGETGLDYHYNYSSKEEQLESFVYHVDIATEFKKPLVIHCREAVADIYSVFKERQSKLIAQPGVMHCFSENLEWGKKFLDLGFFLSFSGILTFRAAETIREVAQSAPLDRIVIETDSPYLAPVPFRGKQNSPAFLPHTFEKLCQIRTESKALIEDTLLQSSKNLYRI
jgi:TatD DNase family protein